MTFYFKNEYCTKKRIFQDYLKNWYKESDSTMVVNYNNLKNYFGKKISEVPIDTIIKYKKYFRWSEITHFADLQWTWDSFASLFPYLEEIDIPINKYLYNCLINPTLDSFLLSELFEQFSHKIRLFKIEEGSDKYGHPPKVNVLEDVFPYIFNSRNRMDFSESFPDSLKNSHFEIGYSFEGPKRFMDILFLDIFHYLPAILCTRKVKQILEAHNLPNHKFYPVQVYINSYWYGKDTLNYFLFITNNSWLKNNLEVESIVLKDYRDVLNLYSPNIIDSLQINTFAQFLKFINPRYHYKNYKYKYLSQIHVINWFDILTINGSDIYTSKRLLNDANKKAA